MWEYINKKRGKKQGKGNNIEKEVWREHLMKLLEGTETYELEEDEGKERYKGSRTRRTRRVDKRRRN